MSDTPEIVGHLLAVANNIEHELEWLPPYFSDAHVQSLRRAAALLEQHEALKARVAELTDELEVIKDWRYEKPEATK